MEVTPLSLARTAVELDRRFEENWHPMGGHGDPVRGPGFDLKRHMLQHGITIARALIESEAAREKAVREERERCARIAEEWDISENGAEIAAAIRASAEREREET